MMKRGAAALAVVVCLTLLGTLSGQQPVPAEARTVVVPIEDGSAGEAAEALRQALGQAGGLKIGADVRTNSLILTGGPDALAQAQGILEGLRQSGGAVRLVGVEVTVAETRRDGEGEGKVLDVAGDPGELLKSVRGLEERGELASVRRMRLSTLDQQQATVQTAARQPLARGVSIPAGQPLARGVSIPAGGFGGRGGRSRTFEFETVGTVVTVTPRVERAGTILLEIAYEHSDVAPAAEPQPAEEGAEAPFNPQGTTQTTMRSTLRVADGGTALLGASDTADGEGGAQLVVLVSARLVEPAGGHRYDDH